MSEKKEDLFETKKKNITPVEYHHPSVVPRHIPDGELVKAFFGTRLAPIVPTPVPNVPDKDYLNATDEIAKIRAHFDLITGAKFYTFPMVPDLNDVGEIKKGKTTRILDLDIENIKILPPHLIKPNSLRDMNLTLRFREWLVRQGYPMDPRCLDKNWWFYNMMHHLFYINEVNRKNLDRLVKLGQKDRERLKEAADALNRLYFLLTNLIKNSPPIGVIINQEKDALKTLTYCEDTLEKYWLPNHEGINGGKGLSSQSGIPKAEQESQWDYDPIEARESLFGRQKKQFIKVEDLIEETVNARVIAIKEGKPVPLEEQERLRKEYKKLANLNEINIPQSKQEETKPEEVK